MSLITSDAWWLYVWHNFSIDIGILLGLLKLWAKVKPSVISNSILELLQQLIFRGKA